MKRAATTLMLMLAMAASAAVVDVERASSREGEGEKTQWAPTRSFRGLNARAVFGVRTPAAASPYAGEAGETAAGGKEAGFTGHRSESALELIYAEQRWQDPRTGTWMSRDPVGAASYLQSPNELNPWQYAAGNPMSFTDPDGREGLMPSRQPDPCDLKSTMEETKQCIEDRGVAHAKALVVGLAGSACVFIGPGPCASMAARGGLIGLGFDGARQGVKQLEGGQSGFNWEEYGLAGGAGLALGPVSRIRGAGPALMTAGVGLGLQSSWNELKSGNTVTAFFDFSSSLYTPASASLNRLNSVKMPNWRLPPPAARPASAVAGGGSMAAAGDTAGVAAAAGDPTGGNPLAVAMAAARGPQFFLPGLRGSETPRLPLPFKEGEIGRYGDFDLQKDSLEGHELLQNAWLEAHGVKNTPHVFAKPDNPAIALERRFHQSVSRMQNIENLHNNAFLRGQSALENINANADLLLRAGGVSKAQVNALRAFAIKHGQALGVIP